MGRERFAMGWRLGLLLLLSGAALLTAVEVVELHDTSLPDVSVSGPLANDELALIQSEDSSTPDERQRAINKIHAILDGKTPNPTHLEPHKDIHGRAREKKRDYEPQPSLFPPVSRLLSLGLLSFYFPFQFFEVSSFFNFFCCK